jgi:hypothetical protein
MHEKERKESSTRKLLWSGGGISLIRVCIIEKRIKTLIALGVKERVSERASEPETEREREREREMERSSLSNFTVCRWGSLALAPLERQRENERTRERERERESD